MSMYGMSYFQTLSSSFMICTLLGYIVLLDYSNKDESLVRHPIRHSYCP